MSISPRFAPSAAPSLPLTARQLATRDRVLARLADGTYATEEVACFCGAPGGLLIAERDRYGLPVRTLLCEGCGLLRTNPRLTPEATARFYDEDYRDLYGGGGDKEKLFAGQIPHGEFFLTLVGKHLSPGARVFEIGCGAGGILQPFAEAGFRVAGCDLGSEYLEAGRARGIELVHGDARALVAHVGEQADLLIISHVVEHFLDLRRELGEALGALNPGGLLLIEVPGLHSVESSYRRDLLLYLQNAHTFHFTDATLRYVLESAGVEVLYVNEAALAIAHKPDGGLRPRTAPPPAGEASRVLRKIVDNEKALLGALA